MLDYERQPDDEEPVVEDSTEETVSGAASDEAMDQPSDDGLDIGEVEGESEMRDMIDFIARVLVDEPDAVQVRSQWSDGRLNINLKVADGDKGKVMGRLMPQVRGKADGAEVNRLAGEILDSLE